MSINLYSPTWHHQPGYVIADRHSLEQLKNAIQSALDNGAAEFNDFDSDGEGYQVRIVLDDEIDRHAKAPLVDDCTLSWRTAGQLWRANNA